MTLATEQALTFLREVGVDLTPDPANIPGLRKAGWSNEMIADTYGVSVRTIQRYFTDYHPCPGYPEGSCLTKVRGGGLCRFCAKTKALA